MLVGGLLAAVLLQVGEVPKDLSSARALNQDEKAAARTEGLFPKLKLGATGSIGQSQRVVGTVDGATYQLGAILDGGLDYRTGPHEWESSLLAQATQTRTPQLDMFVKTLDSAVLRTTYLYHVPAIPWLGPYARAALSTQLFHGFDVRAEPTQVVRTFRDGTQTTSAKASQQKIRLTSPLEPLLLDQGTGLFAKPFVDKGFTAEAKLGVGVQELVVKNGWVVSSDTAPTATEPRILTLTQLEDVFQGGGEFDLRLSGERAEILTWAVGGRLFYAAYSSKDDLEQEQRLSTELLAKVTIRLAKWASLDWAYTAKRLPLIVDAWQIQNGLILTAGFDIL